MKTNSPQPSYPTGLISRLIEVDLLALDLSTCARCLGTLRNIETAVGTLKDALAVTGTEVRLRKVLVESEEHARRLRFAASPTVRINGQDIAFEARESRCDSCTDLCGCAEGTSCRVWPYRGREYNEAPVGLIVEALVRWVAGGGTHAAAPPYAGVPENLRRFFSGRASVGSCQPPSWEQTASRFNPPGCPRSLPFFRRASCRLAGHWLVGGAAR